MKPRNHFWITCVRCGRRFLGTQFDARPNAVRNGIGAGANSSDRGTCRDKARCDKRKNG